MHILAEHGSDTLDPFALRPDKRIFLSSGARVPQLPGDCRRRPSCSGSRSGRRMPLRVLARSSPMPGARAGRRLRSACPPEGLEAWRSLGYQAHYTGDEAIVDPARSNWRDERSARCGSPWRGCAARRLPHRDRAAPRARRLRSRRRSPDRRPLARRSGARRVLDGVPVAAVDRRATTSTPSRSRPGRAPGFLHLAAVPPGARCRCRPCAGTAPRRTA